eukprot:scaffold65387_cov61-Phaeocystis_antarctica.AAC.2
MRTQQKPAIWVAQRDAAVWVRVVRAPRVGIGPPARLGADEQVCPRLRKAPPQRRCAALDDDVCVGEQPWLGRAGRARRLKRPLILARLLPHPRASRLVPVLVPRRGALVEASWLAEAWRAADCRVQHEPRAGWWWPCGAVRVDEHVHRTGFDLGQNAARVRQTPARRSSKALWRDNAEERITMVPTGCLQVLSEIAGVV